MFGKRFFITYTLVWIITGILLLSVEKIDWAGNSIVIRYLAIPAIVITMAVYAVRQMPDISGAKVKRSSIAFMIIGSSVAYTLLRGMIPDGMLPDSVLVELFLKYLYSLALIHILLRTTLADGNRRTESGE
ncbi:hypothetical protein [Youngiibacter fragilis]|uniref:Uncharacterized protein n=1 Tax=Youngiibacter fragilis 232.1 TaxID=994573 RepID=V7I4B0_9CLOT|nr:hypothetical protein [Youngiibacter fragilis]ETA80039.1 hypothetical protein T472_0213730 [Youngiibacter fragilis 232.1]